MKMEHRAIIERAQRDDLLPSEIASELLEHDLIQTCLDQLRGQTVPFGKLSEQAQQDTIERLTLGVKDAVRVAIRTIAANGVVTIPVDIKRVQVDAKNLTVTATVDGKDPKKHDLVDSAGHLCLLVMAPDDYSEGLDGIKAERDQRELPLSANDILKKMDLQQAPTQFKQAMEEHKALTSEDIGGDDSDGLYQEAIAFVIESRRASISAVQRKLKIGYNRAARMIETMEAAGVVTPMNTNGTREVVAAKSPEPEATVETGEFAETKEFGEFTYDDAAQLIVLKASTGRFGAAWIQSRLAIDSDKATSLLLRLIDNGVIQLEAEGPTALEHTYKVVGTLADVV